MQDLINVIESLNDNYTNIDQALKLVEYIEEYRRISKSNIDLLKNYIKLIQSYISILNYNSLIIRKESLYKELELSKIKQKSSSIAAKTDLIKKLKDSLNSNKSQLKYFEEDYFKIKNQINQINHTIKDHNQKIQNLNKEKKDNFSEINKITREMGDPTKRKKDDFSLDFVDNKGLSNAERIKLLQKKAKESQYEINEIKTKLIKVKLKLNEINPKYKKLDIDYQKIKKIIKNDEIRLKSLQEELKNSIKEDKDSNITEINFKSLEIIRNSQEIKDELQDIEREIIQISDSFKIINITNPTDLSKLIDEFQELNTTLTNKQQNYMISHKMEEISECIECFRKLEILKKHLERINNKFLKEINLKSNFNMVIDEDYKSFSITIQFFRSNKEEVNFDQLTTPEKIFFIITLYLSINILLKSKKIIFSNLLLPPQYNKRGSIFRTIRKSITVFENEEDLKEFTLIFIISNLEMKKPIENIKIINLGELS